MNTLDSINYPIYFSNTIAELVKFIENGNYSRFFVLTDENTAKYCLPTLREKIDNLDNFDIIEINAGEESKNIDFCIGVWKMLIDFSADRQSLLINLGGGVISDLGGFAASTYKRGIDFVHVPTTLLSQVDASVGGKTGIDMDNIKNIIGTFTQPKAVFIEHDFLQTLPPRQILSGKLLEAIEIQRPGKSICRISLQVGRDKKQGSYRRPARTRHPEKPQFWAHHRSCY